MTQAKFPVMLDEERAKYVTREIKYEQEIESLRKQLAERTEMTAQDAFDEWMAHDEWQFADREACWKFMFEKGQESMRQQLSDQREAFAVIAETPVSGEQDDITMEAKDRIAKAIREWEPK